VAGSQVVAVTGTVRPVAKVLLTAKEIDEAAERTVAYRPSGK
jgi:hypothetical protein